MSSPHRRLPLVFTSLLPPMMVPSLPASDSIYPERLDDPAAIYADGSFAPELSPGHDVTESLQAAIDAVAQRGTFGLIFIPSGEYRLSDTVYIWKGIRLIGYGPTRPRFVLPSGTPGYAEAEPKYLFHFASNRPEPGEAFRDANPGTFYSALSNMVIAIEPGNPAAVGVRSHFAQHSFLSHLRFEIGEGLAGVQKVGNIFHDLEFVGGEFGIMTTKPSPSWPFTLLNSTFRAQRQAAIQTEEAGLTIVRCRFSDSPRAIEVRANRSEELYIEESLFERLPQGIVVISNEFNARTQVNLVALQCDEVPVIAAFRQSGRAIEGRPGRYAIGHFSHGGHIDGWGASPQIETRLTWVPAPTTETLEVPADPARPLPTNERWINVASLGAIGDGDFDNTALLQDAIDQYEALYFPSGRYRISDTLTLRENSVLVGMSPLTTQLMVRDETPGFHPAGVPKPVLQSAPGGAAILQGLGIEPGGINARAVALKWRAGMHSVVRDVRFLGGHGTFDSAGIYLPIYNNNRSGDSDPRRRWDAMPTSLWVTGGGGGSFVGLWTPSPFAHAGMVVEQTSTPGWVYQMSSEHHLRNEVIVRHAANWSFYALQFEAESWEGRKTLPLLIENSHDLRFNNTYVYRVGRTFTPHPHGIKVLGSEHIDFRGIHLYGPSKYQYDATVVEGDSGHRVLSREITRFQIGDKVPPKAPSPLALIELAKGFNQIESPEIDSAGRLYFVDARAQTIYRWDPEKQRLRTLLDLPIEPSQIVLAPDSKSLVILTRVGKVFRWPIDGGSADLTEVLPLQGPLPVDQSYVVPASRWRDAHDFLTVTQEAKPYHFAVDGLVIPAEESYVGAGPRDTYFRTLDLERSYDLATYRAGERVLVADEFDQKTWSFTMGAQGALSAPVLFAEEGEVGTLALPDGRILIGAGEVLIYTAAGDLERRLEVPGRVTGMALGGADRSTLFILARTQLFALPLEVISD